MYRKDYLSPFRTMLISIGALPTAYIESMSYYEGLTFLVNYLCNNVIPAVESSEKGIEELQAKFLELVDYVDHYFDDLNIQNEVDHKLDEMAEQGELADIILDYLNLNGLIMFDTIEDLEAAENLIEGSPVRTLGKLSYDDGLGSYYKVRELEESDTPDGYNLVALTNYPTLVAERLPEVFESELSNLDSSVGDLASLTTTEKSSLVGAINETVSSISDNTSAISTVDGNVGTLASLTTTDKTDIVSAINEVNAKDHNRTMLYHKTANQSIANETFTVLTYDTETSYSDGVDFLSYNAGTFTALEDGVYMVVVDTVFASSPTGNRFHSVYVNGTTNYGEQSTVALSGLITSIDSTAIIPLSENDTFIIRVYQSSGAALYANDECSFTIIKLR